MLDFAEGSKYQQADSQREQKGDPTLISHRSKAIQSSAGWYEASAAF